MKFTYLCAASSVAFGLVGCAQPDSRTAVVNVSTIAGVYSSAHRVMKNGVAGWTNGYIEIDRSGRITAFEQYNENRGIATSDCYVLATGTDTNAGLQGRVLSLGFSSRGDAVYQTRAGVDDTFGILVEPASSGIIKWFVHSTHGNRTVTINGKQNVIQTADRSSYSISGPALSSPTPARIRDMLCTGLYGTPRPVIHTMVDMTPSPRPMVTASDGNSPPSLQRSSALTTATNLPSPLLTAVPLDLKKPVNANVLAKLGIATSSSKAQIFMEWRDKVASDPDIKAYYLPKTMGLPPGPSLAFSNANARFTGLQRISPEDRDALLGVSFHALDNAPQDCGGLKDMVLLTSRYFSADKESGAAFKAQLEATSHSIAASILSTPPPQLSAAQRLEGQLAFSQSIATTLKHDPSKTVDLALLMSGKQAALSPEAWCDAMRVYRKALTGTPQPARDWIALTRIEDQQHVFSALLAMLVGFQATHQNYLHADLASTIVDYGDAVRQRVRPNIVWDGTQVHGATVLEIKCEVSGKLESVTMIQSSGNERWDKVAISAVERADPMPLQANGEAPRSFRITLRSNM